MNPHFVPKRKTTPLERFSIKATRWIGSISSLVFHTIFFIGSFVLVMLGIPFERVLLVLTTVVSLEAIYLAIFIQMSVNRQARRLHEVSKDIDEIQEDIDEIQVDVDEIQKDIDEIQVDVDEIQEDVEEDDKRDVELYTKTHTRVEQVEKKVKDLVAKITPGKKK